MNLLTTGTSTQVMHALRAFVSALQSYHKIVCAPLFVIPSSSIIFKNRNWKLIFLIVW